MQGTQSVTNAPGRSRRTLAKAILAFAALGIGALFAEWAARVWLVHFAGADTFLRYASLDQICDRLDAQGSRLAPHPYLGFHPRPGWTQGDDRHDSHGFRGEEVAEPKPPGEFRIVCLGGSTTYTSTVKDHRLAYPALLEKELRGRGFETVRVVNAGCPDYGTHETLINFEMRVLDVEPDLVVVYHAINDVPSRLVWPSSAYRGDNTGYRRGRFGPERPPGLLEHSTVLRILAVRLGCSVPHGDLKETYPTSPSSVCGEFDRQSVRGTYPSGIFQDAPVERILAANPPKYFRRNLETLIDVARARGIAVVLATFAYYPVDAPPHRTAYCGPVFFRAIDEHNEVLRRLAADTKTPLFDFAETFPRDPRLFHVTVRGDTRLLDAVHVNEDGSRLMARQFAGFLAGTGLLPQ